MVRRIQRKTLREDLEQAGVVGCGTQDGSGSVAKAVSARGSGKGVASVGGSFFKSVSQVVLTSTPITREETRATDRSIRVC
jgi:hypothetical protein